MELIGVDLHSDSFYVVRTRSTTTGVIRTEKRYALCEGGLDSFVQTLSKADYLLVEATTNAFWFRDRVRPFVRECFILNVNAVKFAGNKTDRIDARRLLDLLSYYVHVRGIAEMPTVYVPRPEVRQLRSLLSTYHLCRKIENQLKNRIHSLLKQAGVVIAKQSLLTAAAWERVRRALHEDLALHVQLLFAQLQEAKKTTASVRDAIVSLGAQTFPEEIKLLLTIPGFGVLTAVVLLADIDTVSRFRSAKKFCAYLRTAPRIKESNSTTHLGRVSKQSRSMTCSILTQSVIHFKKAGPHFAAFYERIRTGKSSGKARVALIRKMLVAAYFMLKRRQMFSWADPGLQERKNSRILQQVEKARRSYEAAKELSKVA